MASCQYERYERASWHSRRARECESAIGKLQPYKSSERLKILSQDPRAPKHGFTSWEAEHGYQTYWAQRFEETAVDWDKSLKSSEAKLRFP